MAKLGELLKVHGGKVLDGWVDFNGHMADAYYGVVFSDAVTRFMDMIGMDAGYRERTHNTIYTLEVRMVYLHECKAGQSFKVLLQLLDLDQKRFHAFVKMIDDASGHDVAWSEQLLLHTHQDPLTGPKSSAFDADVMSRLEEVREAHRKIEVPDWIGGRVGIRRK